MSFSGDDVVRGLDIDKFHTYRFESLDGIHCRMSVDGYVFFASYDDNAISSAYVQFGGDGGCGPEYLPTVNEWDFVRYGTISYGETIVASDPPSGFVDARTYAPLDRFTVTFDEPNYVYIDEISVEVAATKPRSLEGKRRNVKKSKRQKHGDRRHSSRDCHATAGQRPTRCGGNRPRPVDSL